MNLIASILVLTNLAFTVAVDPSVGPVWAEYRMDPSRVVKASRAHRPFRTDPRVPVPPFAYRGSGYDRGHLVPAADMNWSTNALAETYLYSNVCPMTKAVNRGPWESTEREVRRLALSNEVHVLVIPLYLADPVPAAFVKVAWGPFGVRYWKIDQ